MRVLAVGGERSLPSLVALIHEAGCEAVPVASGAEARRRILDEEWDEVVINYPLPDEQGLDLARMVQEESNAICIMLMRSENLPLAGNLGAITVEKPLIKPVFFQALHLGMSIRARLSLSEKRIMKLERRIEEMKLESKAKCALSLRLGLTEEEGHRYMETMAMDKRITLRDAAYSILMEE